MSYGFEAIEVYIPKQYIDAEDLAAANDVDPAKYTHGIGMRRIAVPAPHEDAVTMAYEAARTLLDEADCLPEEISLLIVGSETGVDASKPIASFVHGLLGLSGTCRTFDTKHACYSATAAIRMAAEWCAGRGRGKKALIIASDVARYEVGSPGEPTQGAGAVAMLVSDTPTLFVFEDHPEAIYTHDVMDFWRPEYRSTALVNGKLSLDCYLAGLRETWTTYCELSGLGWHDYDALLFHAPFPKMAAKGYQLLAEIEGEGQDGFASRTAPYLDANRQVGNIYSGSLYLSLAQLLRDATGETVGQRVGLYSYGSGSCGEFFSGVVGPGAAAGDVCRSLADCLETRCRLSHPEYLRSQQASRALAANGTFHQQSACRRGGCPEAATFLGVRDHERVYCRPTPGSNCLWIGKSEPRSGIEHPVSSPQPAKSRPQFSGNNSGSPDLSVGEATVQNDNMPLMPYDSVAGKQSKRRDNQRHAHKYSMGPPARCREDRD